MLQTLLESRAHPQPRARGTVISIGVHTALIALAIVATARATVSPARNEPEVTQVFYTSPPRRDPWRGTAQPAEPAPFLPIIETPVIPPVRVPDQLPSLDLRRPLTMGAIGDSGQTAVGTGLLGTRTSGLTSPTDGVFTAAMVERAVAPRPGNPAPVYPAAMRSAHLEGSVVARFIVDTSGRAEAGSIIFQQASHPDFATAVRQALLRSRYLPAMVDGHPVRQLVEQRFEFTLQR